MSAGFLSNGKIRIWVEALRLRTLPAAIAPVLVGTALAARADHVVWPAAAACLAFALLIQIGTNFANDYHDFRKGADTAERIGPRRAVASGLVKPETMRRVTAATFALAFLVGLSLLPYGGWPLLLIGVASIVCGYAYTAGPYPLAYNGLGDLFVFIFFGLVAVGATTWVQTHALSAATWLAGAGAGALAANILLVNNYRDFETDAKAGKRTLVVCLGRRFARGQFAGAHALAAIIPLALLPILGLEKIPALLLSLLAGAAGYRQWAALRAASTPHECIHLLGKVGRWLAVYAVLLSIAIASC